MWLPFLVGILDQKLWELRCIMLVVYARISVPLRLSSRAGASLLANPVVVRRNNVSMFVLLKSIRGLGAQYRLLY